MDIRLNPVATETNENRATFEAFCRALSPAELSAIVPGGTWMVRDYISHLASIDLYVGEWFEHLADGRTWRPKSADGGSFSIDPWNEARISERMDSPVDELLSEAARHRAGLWAAVDRFSPEVLDARFDFRGNSITLLRYLQLWATHDPAHTADMRRALPHRIPA